MLRRTFLSLCTGVSTAAAIGGVATWLGPLSKLVSVDSSANLFPGSLITAQLSKEAPARCELVAVVLSKGRAWRYPAGAAEPGSSVTLRVPYPFDDIVAGTYDVEIELTRSGRCIEKHAAGAYTLRPFRFSA